MGIKTVPLSRLETNLQSILNECADSGETLVVEMPDHRLLSVRPLDPHDEDDDLVNHLIETNPEFRAMLARSSAEAAVPFDFETELG